MTLIGLAGYKGSGKSVVADHLVQAHGFERVRLAGVLKDMLRTFGLDDRQIDGNLKEVPDAKLLAGKTPRWAMQSLGTEWGRECIDDEVWVKAWWAKAQPILDLGGSVVCDDVRFLNESSFIRDHDGFVIRVDRPGFEPQPKLVSQPRWIWRLFGAKPKYAVHPSERIDFEVDYQLTNDATVDNLRRETDRLLWSHRRRWESELRPGDNLLDFPTRGRA